jgi:cytochrome P450
VHMAATLPPGLRWDTARGRLKVTTPDLADVIMHDPHIITGIQHGHDPAAVRLPADGELPSVSQFFQLWYTVGADYPRFNTELRKAFTAGVVRGFDTAFNAMARGYVRALPVRGELAAGYFLPFFMHSTFDMIGVPDADWPNLAKAAKLVVHLFKQQLLGVREHSPRELYAFATVMHYLRSLTDRLLAADIDTPFLAAARVLVRDPPNNWPIAALIGQLLMAGIEPMVAGAAEGGLAIWRDPELLARARAGTADFADIAEDAMRRRPPFEHIFRFVARPCDCLGVPLAPGTVLAVEVAPVNMANAADGGCPVKPGAVWTFGKGTHYCLGANSARLQVAAAIRQLAVARPGIRLVEPARFDSENNLRQVISLPYLIKE